MNAGVRNAEVVEFVASVRRALDDLTPEEVDELTGGLEADLDDAVLDGGPGALGDPLAYAAELRAAAGLPQRGRPAGGSADPLSLVRQGIERARHGLDAHPLWPPVRDFLVTLRPVWWIARAWVAYQLVSELTGGGLHTVLPYGVSRWVLFCGFVVLSVELGRRGAARRNRWWRRGFAVANVVAALAVLPLLSVLPGPAVVSTVGDVVVPPENGLWLNGREVRNVFPYDAQGNPLTDVQLYDENGKPLEVGRSARTPLERPSVPYPTTPSGGVVSDAQVPAVDANNRPAWNVYPLRQQEIDSGDVDSTGQGRALTPPSPAPLPMRLAPVVAPPRAAGSAAPSPSSSSSSSSSPVPSPSS